MVANAWDAGASKVSITIKVDGDEEIIVEDDGCGMTEDEFRQRWLTLSYNRLEHQGKNVVFPAGVNGKKRLAFGRNGIGRHGMLCFSDSYVVKTYKGCQENMFCISATSKTQALAVEPPKQRILSQEKHGTKLVAKIERNRPDPDKILEELAKRFVADPSFLVEVNQRSIDNSDLMQEAPCENLEVEVNNQKIKIEILLIDTEKAHKRASYQGIAFWQAGRLIGEPSWTIGSHMILDGRTQNAKRYTLIVRSNDFEQFINEDWTGFLKSDALETILNEVASAIEKLIGDLNLRNIQGIKQTVKQDYIKDINSLSRIGKIEIDDVITEVVTNKPSISNEALSVVVGAVVKIEQSRSGTQLLQKLTCLDSTEIDALNRLLDDWNIKDALTVLDEIDRRLTVISAISKLHGDKSTNELHTLHPLITAARWIFGPEFDSQEYSANHQLRTIAKTLFNVSDADFQDGIKRPDLIVKGDSTIGFTATEDFGDDGISYLGRILLIELKRGGFNITRDERNQAQEYVEQLYESHTLPANCRVSAFVVGDSIANESIRRTLVCNERGIVNVVTFAQLIDTANKRLFRLREILANRYEKISGQELADKAIQMQLNF